MEPLVEMVRSDPLVQLCVIGALIFLLMLVWAGRAAQRSARAAEPLAAHLGHLTGTVQGLDAGQHQLAGALNLISEQQNAAQARIMEQVERRLEDVQQAMGQSLHGTATRTARALGALQERLDAIDRAQSNIEKLSGDVLSLQDILANKQTRGAFGEIQLHDIVSQALPPDSYKFQGVLSNGRRADCLIRLPSPPGLIAIDAKFPLEAYEALRTAETEDRRKEARRLFRKAFLIHIRDIADRYIVEGETADSALMFLPSEAVYAELHANFPEIVQQSFAARVWIVSPTTMMAVLNTMRAILKDARMREQAGHIRRELGLLHKDVERLIERAANLDRHFSQATRDVEEIRVSAAKVGGRARRLEAFEFEQAERVSAAE